MLVLPDNARDVSDIHEMYTRVRWSAQIITEQLGGRMMNQIGQIKKQIKTSKAVKDDPVQQPEQYEKCSVRYTRYMAKHRHGTVRSRLQGICVRSTLWYPRIPRP